MTMNNYINGFNKARILVIGDIMLDKYICGNVSRISPEAPVPVVEVENEIVTLGGAANVAHNLALLGAKPIVCGVIGTDTYGGRLLSYLGDLGLEIYGVVADPNRPTTIKTRVVGNNSQIVRFDRESTNRISNENKKTLLGFVKDSLKSIDGIIVSDYNKGVVSSLFMHDLMEIVNGSNIFIASDPHKDNFYRHKYVNILTPNTNEAGYYCGFNIKNEKDLEYAGKKILHDLRCGSVLITRSEKGMALFEAGGDITYIPTVPQTTFDVSGAGDTVIGVFTLGIIAGMDPKDAAKLANIAAGVVVGEIGTAVITTKKLKAAIIK
ncbi:hypothetical protein LCGC14_0530470 [marine sediment metagenome]|uniref:Carbohydrate kinase PfkB domain-containing protein n=1 Tax=marine sediment metagenome TaxID=412755 RepID=A0A0F9SE66_9ZZZZ